MTWIIDEEKNTVKFNNERIFVPEVKKHQVEGPINDLIHSGFKKNTNSKITYKSGEKIIYSKHISSLAEKKVNPLNREATHFCKLWYEEEYNQIYLKQNPKIANTDETGYSTFFKNTLETLLPPSEDFKKMSLEDQQLIEKKISYLYHYETSLQYFQKKSTANINLSRFFLIPQKRNFYRGMSFMLRLTDEGGGGIFLRASLRAKRVFDHFLSFLKGLMKELCNNSLKVPLFSPEQKEYFREEVYEELLKSLDIMRIFDLIVREAVKQGWGNMKNKVFGELINDFQNPFSTATELITSEEDQIAYPSLMLWESDIYPGIEKKILEGLLHNLIRLIELKLKSNLDPDLKNSPIFLGVDSVFSSEEEVLILEKTQILSNFIRRNALILESRPEYRSFQTGCTQIIKVFKNNVLEKHQQIFTQDRRTGETVSKIQWVLPKGVDTLYNGGEHLPKITPPKDWTTSSFDSENLLMNYIHMGSSNMALSQATISAINTHQRKEFQIDEKILRLFKKLDKEVIETVSSKKLPFPSQATHSEKQRQFSKVFEVCQLVPHLVSCAKYASLLKMRYNSFKNSITGIQNSEGILKNVSQKTGKTLNILCTQFHKSLWGLVSKTKKDLNSERQKRFLLQTAINLADIFKGYPLYYTTFMDYRGRKYIREFLFNRTTGSYRYLCKPSKEEKLTKEGLIGLLRAYYAPSYALSEDFESFLGKKKPKTLKGILKFWTKNKITLQDKNQHYIYFERLEMELSVLEEKKFSTSITIEIDQKTSGATLLAITLGNKALLTFTNVSGGYRAYDFNRMLQINLQEFLDFHYQEQLNTLQETLRESDSLSKSDQKEYEKKADIIRTKITYVSSKECRLINLFKNHRKLMKMAFMCYIYSQGAKKRLLAGKSYFIDLDISLDSLEYNILGELSVHFEKYVDFLCPNFKKQMKALKDLYKEYVNMNTVETTIKTLDESLISGSFFPTKTYTGRAWSPYSKYGQNYQRQVPYNIEDEKILQVRKKSSDCSKTIKRYLKTKFPEDAERLKQEEMFKGYNRNTLMDLYKGTTDESLKEVYQALLETLEYKKVLKESQNMRKERSERMERTFRPNFIHAKDGAIVRLVTLAFIQETKNYAPEPQHDCFSLHPNYTSLLYRILKKIYKNILIGPPLIEYFTMHFKSKLAGEDVKKLNDLTEELFKTQDTFEIDPESIVIENMYLPEGVSEERRDTFKYTELSYLSIKK